MVDARRAALPQSSRSRYLPGPVSHAGLEMGRYVSQIEAGGEQEERRRLIQRLADATPPPIYDKAYRQWEQSLAHANTRTEVAHAHNGLLVGLGAESVLETALTLHHVYGTPLIPGDALKGLARHYFEQLAAPPRPNHSNYVAQLFGGADSAGYVTYYDAWYVPGTAGGHPFKPDVLTPHHPRYNAGSGGQRAAPTDFDDPTPVSFLQAQGGYLIAVRGPNAACADFALALLLQALADWGAGGKTSSGYGRLRPGGVPAPSPGIAGPLTVSSGAAGEATAGTPPGDGAGTPPELARRISLLSAANLPGQVTPLGQAWQALPEGEEKRTVARVLQQRMQEAKLLNTSKWRDKPWVQALVSYLAPDAPA